MINIYRNYGIFCENKNCWYTFWKIMLIKDLEKLLCPRCGSKCKIIISEIVGERGER